MGSNNDQTVFGELHLAPCPAETSPILRIGGAPKLPQSLDWPQDSAGHPLHFFATVDLAQLLANASTQKRMMFPDHPNTGTVFLFLNMFAHADDMVDARILYTSDPITDTPDRAEICPKVGDGCHQAAF